MTSTGTDLWTERVRNALLVHSFQKTGPVAILERERERERERGKCPHVQPIQSTHSPPTHTHTQTREHRQTLVRKQKSKNAHTTPADNTTYLQ